MLTHTTWLIARMDPLKYVFKKPTLTGRIARWHMLLSEYNILYVTQKAIKGSVLANHLAHQPLPEYQPMKFDFPDEDVMVTGDYGIPGPDEGPEPGERWTVMFDRASNEPGHRIGAFLTSPKIITSLILQGYVLTTPIILLNMKLVSWVWKLLSI